MPGSPRDLADRMASKRLKRGDGFVRETFTQPREQARSTARAFFDRFPKQAYMSKVDGGLTEWAATNFAISLSFIAVLALTEACSAEASGASGVQA